MWTFQFRYSIFNLGAISGSTILFKKYFVFQLTLVRTVYKSIIIIVIVIVISYNSTIFIFQPISVENNIFVSCSHEFMTLARSSLLFHKQRFFIQSINCVFQLWPVYYELITNSTLYIFQSIILVDSIATTPYM